MKFVGFVLFCFFFFRNVHTYFKTNKTKTCNSCIESSEGVLINCDKM